MDEARRFLRYVLPGYVYFVETGLFLLIIFPRWTVDLLSKTTDNLGTVLGSIFVASAFGYIFSTVHHWLYWILPSDRGVLNHVPLIKRLEHYLSVGSVKERQEALEISCAYWYQLSANAISSEGVKKLNSLGDMTHSLGAARIASVFALATTLLVGLKIGECDLRCEPILRFILMMFLSGITIYAFHSGYKRVGIIAQNIYDRLFEDAIRKRGTYKRGPGPKNENNL